MKRDRLLFVKVVKVDEDQRIVEGYATTDAIDLDGEIVDLDATREAVEEYRQWSNVRYMHQAHAVGVVKEMNVDEKGLYVKVKVVDDECWVKVKEGVLKAFSIGFRVLDCVWDALKEAWRITKYRFIEISLVDRPANPECAYSVIKRAGADAGPDADISFKFPKAPDDEPWKFRAADYELEQLARACAYVKGVADPHGGDLPEDLAKSDCKLPHHKADGTLVWRGVAAAMAALLGARGGVDLPEKDRKRAYAHLKKHYGEFDKEVPEFKAIGFLVKVLDFLGLLDEPDDDNEPLANFPTKAAGTSTEEESEMNEEQVKKLVADEVGKAKGEILTELGGKIDELKAALPAAPTADEGKDGDASAPETPAELAAKGVDEKVRELDERVKGLEAGSSKAPRGQDDVTPPKEEKWAGVMDNVFH